MNQTISVFLLFAVLGRTAIGQSYSIVTLAGTGEAISLDGPVERAKLNNPFGVVRGPNNNLWFCEYDGHTVRKIDNDGNVSTVVGNGKAGYQGDGDSARLCSLNQPHEIRFDKYGDLFIADMRNHVVRKVDLGTQIIETIAGNGTAGFSGDGNKATNAQLNQPHSIQFGPDGNLFIADVGNHRVRMVEMKTGIISTLAGNGTSKPTRNGVSFRDEPLSGPRSIDFDKHGDLWLVLKKAHQIFRLDMKKDLLYHMAGIGTKGFTGDGGDAREAQLSGPKGISIAQNGLVFIADTESHSIRMIDLDGRIHLVAGTGSKFDGKEGDALDCGLARPHGVFVDHDGSILIGDSENHKIRKLIPSKND